MMEKIKSRDVQNSKRSSKGKVSKSMVTKSVNEDGSENQNTWDCSVCTFKNSAEAFKCLMCDVRKGTSTRKPRINPELVAQQVARQQQHLLQKISSQNLPKSPVKSSKMIDSSPASPGPSHSNSSTNLSRDSQGKEKDNHARERDSQGREKDKESHKNYNNLTKSNLNNNNHSKPIKTPSNDDCDCSQQAVTVNNVTVWIKEFLRYTKSPPRSPQEADNVVP